MLLLEFMLPKVIPQSLRDTALSSKDQTSKDQSSEH